MIILFIVKWCLSVHTMLRDDVERRKLLIIFSLVAIFLGLFKILLLDG